MGGLTRRLWVAWIHQTGRSVRAATPPFEADNQTAADAEAVRRTGTSYAFAIPGPAVVTQPGGENASSGLRGASTSILP